MGYCMDNTLANATLSESELESHVSLGAKARTCYAVIPQMLHYQWIIGVWNITRSFHAQGRGVINVLSIMVRETNP